MATERLKGVPLSREVPGGFIAHQIAIVEGNLTTDSPELAQERSASRFRTSSVIYEFKGHPLIADGVLFGKPGGGRGQEDAPKKCPRGYSPEYWELQQKQARKHGPALSLRRR